MFYEFLLAGEERRFKAFVSSIPEMNAVSDAQTLRRDASSGVRNVIYIHAHDMGRMISPYGYAVSTPSLQAFAEKATTFRRAFCCGPTCSPSRAGLLTGITPHQSGMIGLAHCGFRLKSPQQHLASYLRTHGFTTALCGIQHEFYLPHDELPYDQASYKWHPDGCRETDRAWADSAVAFLDRRPQEPFFLSVGLFYPHRPFEPADPARFSSQFIKPPDPLPDTSAIRKDMADYHQSVFLTDACIGKVFEGIRRNGYEENSLVIVTTDHGPAFPGMKCQLTDHGIGVALLLDFPGNISRGTASDALVSHLDVFPTVCDLLDLRPPDYLQGRSMRPLLERECASIRSEIFSEVTFHAAYEPMRCIRTERFKLIRRFGPRVRRSSNCDPSPSKELFGSLGWFADSLAEYELYDLLLDPQEGENLADAAGYAETFAELRARLDEWMQLTDDPLLVGDVMLPPGAKLSGSEAEEFSNGSNLAAGQPDLQCSL